MARIINSLLFWYVVTLVVQIALLVNYGLENVTPSTITLMLLIELALPPLIKSYVAEAIAKWYDKR